MVSLKSVIFFTVEQLPSDQSPDDAEQSDGTANIERKSTEADLDIANISRHLLDVLKDLVTSTTWTAVQHDEIKSASTLELNKKAIHEQFTALLNRDMKEWQIEEILKPNVLVQVGECSVMRFSSGASTPFRSKWCIEF